MKLLPENCGPDGEVMPEFIAPPSEFGDLDARLGHLWLLTLAALQRDHERHCPLCSKKKERGA